MNSAKEHVSEEVIILVLKQLNWNPKLIATLSCVCKWFDDLGKRVLWQEFCKTRSPKVMLDLQSTSNGSYSVDGNRRAATHKMRLEKEQKRTFSVPEMHKIRHIKKDKKKGEIWVEPRAKETWEKATKAFEDHRSTQQSECGSSTPAPLMLEDETKIWLEINGGVKKESAYGLGTMYASEKANSSFLGSYALAPSSFANPEEMARMKEEIAELKRQNEAIRRQNEAIRKANADHRTKMEQMMEKILSKTEERRKKKERKGKSSSKGKNKSKHWQSSSSESCDESSSGSTQ